MKTVSDIKLSKIIVDASVAVKWFAFEPDTPQARAIFHSILESSREAHAPDLLFYEVANSLWKSKHLPPERIKHSLDSLVELGIKFHRLDQPIYQLAIDFMVTYDLSFYDAVYGAIAKSLQIPLLTANPKDHKKIKEIEVVDL